MKNILKYVSILFVGVVVGISINSGETAASPETVEVAGPERIVTEEVTKEVIIEKTPQVCVDALELAGEGFSIAGEFADAAAAGFQAGADFDVEGIYDATRRIEETTEDLGRLQPELSAATEECVDKA